MAINEVVGRKVMFGSMDISKHLSSLSDYSCELIIEEYETRGGRQYNQYLKFTPEVDGQPFNLTVDKFQKPQTLMHLFRTEGTREKFKILIEDKLEYKLQTTMQRELKRMTVVEEDDSRSEYLEDDGVELRILQLDSDEDYDSDSSQSKGLDPSQNDKKKITIELIKYLLNEQNRLATLKQIRAHLRTLSYNISQPTIKSMLSEICVKNADKKQGYVLKDQFCPENQRKNPGKRLKPNQSQ